MLVHSAADCPLVLFTWTMRTAQNKSARHDPSLEAPSQAQDGERSLYESWIRDYRAAELLRRHEFWGHAFCCHFLSIIVKFAARHGIVRPAESDAWTSSRYSPFGREAIGTSRAIGIVVLLDSAYGAASTGGKSLTTEPFLASTMRRCVVCLRQGDTRDASI
jgi:hypothetical protein